MKLAWTLLLLGAGLSAQARQFPVEIIEQFDNARVVAFIQESHLKAAPSWNPLDGPPPLTVAQAVEKVKALYARNRGGNAEGLSVEEIELRKVSGREGHWHYLFRCRESGETTYYVVLFNGDVIPAVQEPQSYK